MANGRILIGKPSGGVTTVTSVDGASNTTLVLPESGTVATQSYVDGKMVLGTAVATTSGTSIDFTDIPSWAKKITVMFNGVSLSGSSYIQIQLGAGSVETTGYNGTVASFNSSILSSTNITTGLSLFTVNASGSGVVTSGVVTLNKISANIWCIVFNGNHSPSQGVISMSSCQKELSGILDRVRITTGNGTDSFDDGLINIMYEG